MQTAEDFYQQLPRELPVRVRRMMKWLLHHQEDIDQPESVQVTFSCKDRSVWAEVVKKDKIKDTGPLG
jgi:hypothetical protein